MKNYGLLHFKDADVETFTSDIGMEIRRKINPALRKALLSQVKGEVIVDNYPKLEEDKPYIFVSLHNFMEDTIANLAVIDRNAYVLFGTTNQLEENKQVYAAWLNGFIYVDRYDEKSRKDAVKKMLRVLNNGSSVLIFAEGGLNNSENLLCQKLFSSPYILAKETGLQVVPSAPFYEFGSGKIYMNYGEPIDLAKFESKEEALGHLRDVLSTLLYESMEKHCTPIVRSELGKDPRLDFMEQRRQEYLSGKWTKDVWDEELTQYLDAGDKEQKAVEESMDNIVITKDNAYIMGPILERRREKKKYDFKNYMHENWNK